MSHELIIDRNSFSIFRCLWPEKHGQSNYRGSILDSYVRISPLIWSVLWISTAASVHPGNLILTYISTAKTRKNDSVTIDSAIFHIVQCCWIPTQASIEQDNGNVFFRPRARLSCCLLPFLWEWCNYHIPVLIKTIDWIVLKGQRW